jgi:uncharacterized protein YvpB
MKINLSPTREKYYSQRNNELNPYDSCNVTSMVMGLDIAGFGLDPIKSIAQYSYDQPEDRLRWFMLNDTDIQNFWRRNHPQTTIPAPEWADCMVFAINKLYGKNIVYFDGQLTMKKITDDLKNGLPIYTSNQYPNNYNFSGVLSPVLGHIVLIVGIVDEKLVINDPYKNHLTGNKDGYNNVYLPEDWQKCNKGYGIRYRKDD